MKKKDHSLQSDLFNDIEKNSKKNIIKIIELPKVKKNSKINSKESKKAINYD